MSPRFKRYAKVFAVTLSCTALLSCNVGQSIKTLGKKALTGASTPATDADAFSVTLAYQNTSELTTALKRVISIQGIRGVPSANLVNECGTTGSQCVCDFYKTATDTAPITSAVAGISFQNNSFSCTIPSCAGNIACATGAIDSQITTNVYNFVKLRRTDVVAKNTSILTIKRILTLEDVLGSSLSRTKVRGIFKYNCNRTFFEGEGVEVGQIVCLAGQHLGIISATYNFYTFRSGEDRNDGGGDSAFDSAICSRNSFLKIQCTGNTPELRYAFYKESAEPFVVGITMTRAPEGENLTASYGFAALPDSAGNCPTGLIKVRPWVAQPGSIIQDSLGDSNPPSNFINTGNALNNTVVEQIQPANFVVSRQKNQTPCANDGTCNAASFAGTSTAQSVAYTGLTPVVCAIPLNLLSGLF